MNTTKEGISSHLPGFRLTRRDKEAIGDLINSPIGNPRDLRDLPLEGDVADLGGDVPESLVSRIVAKRRFYMVGAAAGIGTAAALGAGHLSDVLEKVPGVHRGINVAHADGNPTVDPTDNGYDGDLPISTPTPDTTIIHTEPTPTSTRTVEPTPTSTRTVEPTPTSTATKTPEPTPTGTPVPEEEVQVITKKFLEGNGGIAQDYKVWVDLDRDTIRDGGEPAQSGRTNDNGIDVRSFRGNFSVGDQFCSEEVNVSDELEPVVPKDCDTLDSSLTAENQLVNRNKPRSTPTGTAVPPTIEPTVAPPTPEKKVVLPPPPPPVVKPPVCPDGVNVLPAEFAGAPPWEIEAKCELIAHDQLNTYGHAVLEREHQILEEGIGIDANGDGETGIVDKDGNIVKPSLSDQIGVGLGEPSIAQRQDKTNSKLDRMWTYIRDGFGNGIRNFDKAMMGLSAFTALAVTGLYLRRTGGRNGQPSVKPPAPVAPPPVPEGGQPPAGQAPQPEHRRFLGILPIPFTRRGQPAAEVREPGVVEAPAHAVVPEGGPVVAVVAAVDPAGRGDQHEAPPAPGRFTDEQIQTLARVFEAIDEVFNRINKMTDPQLRPFAARLTEDQVNAIRQAITFLSEQLVDEEELNTFSRVRLLRLLSDGKKAINKIDTMRIAQAREQLRARGAA